MGNTVQSCSTIILVFFCCCFKTSASRFIFVDDFATCSDAIIECENREMTLASIHSTIENQEVATLCPDSTLCIIGAIRDRGNRKFTWIDSTAWDFLPPWNADNPDVPIDKSSCVLIYGNTATWYDFIADAVGGAYICGTKNTTTTTTTTTTTARMEPVIVELAMDTDTVSGNVNNYPSNCNGECDAYAVSLDNVEEKKNDVICLTYSVNRLFDTGVCTKSVQTVTLGLYNNDNIGNCNYKDLNGIISSVHSVKFPNICAYDEMNGNGITVDFKGKVDTETTFILCLRNVFKSMTNGEYSNNVQLKRGRNTYSCNKPHLVGLLPLDCISTSSNGGTYGRSTNNANEADDSPWNAISNIDETVKYSLLSIFIVFIILMIIAGYICIIKRPKQKQKINDTEDDNTTTSINIVNEPIMDSSDIDHDDQVYVE